MRSMSSSGIGIGPPVMWPIISGLIFRTMSKPVQFGASSYTLNLINFGVQMSDVSYRLDGSNTIFSNAPFFNFFPKTP